MKRKLKLTRETVRNLTDTSMARVHGGGGISLVTTFTVTKPGCVTYTCYKGCVLSNEVGCRAATDGCDTTTGKVG